MEMRDTNNIDHVRLGAPFTARETRRLVRRIACYQTRVSAMRHQAACATTRRQTCTELAAGTRSHGVHVATGLESHPTIGFPCRSPGD